MSPYKDLCEEMQDLPKIAENCFLMSLRYGIS